VIKILLIIAIGSVLRFFYLPPTNSSFFGYFLFKVAKKLELKINPTIKPKIEKVNDV